MDKETLMQRLYQERGRTAPLPLQLIQVSGPDAQEFLQGQLTLDLRRLDLAAHRLTAWCNPKGRVWCVLRIWRTPEGFSLALSADQSAAFVQRMRMFVLRAKVSLDPVALRIQGDIQPDQATALVDVTAEHTRLRLDEQHGLVISASPAAPASNRADAAFTALRLLAGEPQIDAQTQEQFLPQSLGLQQLDGLHFNKGCFVGQEIVARVHYRGRAPQQLACLIDPPPEALQDTVLLREVSAVGHRIVQVVERVRHS